MCGTASSPLVRGTRQGLVSYRSRSVWFEMCSLLILSCSLCTTLFTTKGTVTAIDDRSPRVPQRVGHLFVFFPLGQLGITLLGPAGVLGRRAISRGRPRRQSVHRYL